MFGLTPFGAFHTAISLIALAAGALGLLRDGRISPANVVGKIYIVTTIVSAGTGLFIFHHGGFGKPHVLSILTLAVLAVAALATRTAVFGSASRYVEALAYSLTFFFHWIPGLTETLTRLPAGTPLLSGPDAPQLKVLTGILFFIFLAGAALQVRRLRGERGPSGVRAR